jgi:hypothetical protein
MAEEQAAGERPREAGQEMDLMERRLWRAGLIAALVFIGIAILVAGHHRRRVLIMAPPQGWGMRMGPGFGPPPPPPPPWGGPGEYFWRGWGPGPGSGNAYGPAPYGPPGQQPPSPPRTPRD